MNIQQRGVADRSVVTDIRGSVNHGIKNEPCRTFHQHKKGDLQRELKKCKGETEQRAQAFSFYTGSHFRSSTKLQFTSVEQLHVSFGDLLLGIYADDVWMISKDSQGNQMYF